MELKELHLEEIQHEHPLILIDLQLKYQDLDEYDDDDYDDDDVDDNDLITMQKFKCICDRCGLGIDWYHRYYYKCSSISCSYSVHKFCAEICTSLRSPDHPSHILILKTWTTNWRCGGCLTDHQDGICYHCSICDYAIDLHCATFQEQKTVHHPAHPHSLIAVTVDPIFSACFACGKVHNGDFYHCSTCRNFLINSHCLSLPIKLFMKFHHSHMLTLSTSFSDQLYGFICMVCKKEIYNEKWRYKCSKCTYNVHIDCATRNLQHLVDTGGRGRELGRSVTTVLYTNPTSLHSISNLFSDLSLPLPFGSFSHKHVLGFMASLLLNEVKNENGYLKHFSHKHPLVLIHNNNNTNDTSGVESSLHNPMKRVKVLCDGCVRPIIATPFYKCSQECSNFVLHDWCARLRPELKVSHFHMHTLVLRQSCSLFCCQVCGLPCNGFAYSCDSCEYCIDVHCGIAPIILRYDQPQLKSPLLYLASGETRINNHLTCRACHNIIYTGMTFYTSGVDDFCVDMLCAWHLPETIRHKYDKHPLKLSYSPIENHKGQYVCEVCEEDLNPEKWFYHCSDCDHSIHSACSTLILKSEQGANSSDDDLVYKFTKMKFGGVHDIEDHKHSLSFVAGNRNDGNCTKCGLTLHFKFILKCLQCKFAIHSYCQSSVTESAKQQIVEMFNYFEKKRESTIKPRTQRVLTYYPKGITRPVTEL